MTAPGNTMKRPYAILGLGILAAGAAAWMLWPEPADEGTGRPIVAVAVPDLTPVERKGEAAFNANCARCHGDDASGVDGSGPPLVHVIYEPDHHGDAAFLLAARQGVRQHHWPFGDMPPVQGLSEEKVAAIVAYVRRVQQANGIY